MQENKEKESAAYNRIRVTGVKCPIVANHLYYMLADEIFEYY
jgi:hypothetical protein